MSGETKVLYSPVERGQERVPVVSQGEWSEIFSHYPDHLRYHAANLAAHNWHVVMVNGRILIGIGSGSSHWIDKDGTRTPLTDEETDAFFPRGGDRYSWPKHSFDQSSKCYRQNQIVLPA